MDRMKLSEVKVCEWCEKEFTGRRVLSDDGHYWWCSNQCYMDEMEHNGEMGQLISENGSYQREFGS